MRLPLVELRTVRSWARRVLFLGPPALLLLFGGEALLRARIKDPLADGPVRVYARPYVIQEGAELNATELREELRRRGYRRTRSRSPESGQYWVGRDRWVIGRRPFRHHGQFDPAVRVTLRMGYDGRVYSIRKAGGSRLARLSLEPELLGNLWTDDREDRIPVPLTHVPDHLIKALLTVEDRRFFEHTGLDYRRIAGAALANVKSGGFVQGGSTITQQLVKNRLLSPRRSPIRKLREALMARVLESRYGKDEILQAYLNEIYFAQDGPRAIHGVGRAAQYFFGKDITELELHESALLAGIVRGPSMYSPVRHPERALERRNLVLDLMHEGGVIEAREHRVARGRGLGVVGEAPLNRNGRYFLDLVRLELERRDRKELLRSGRAVFTSLDLGLQRSAERAVGEVLQTLERRHTHLQRGDGSLQAALVAMDPRSGDVLAMVGGRDYGASQFNRAVHARRQPGSSFKPVVAMAALARHSESSTPYTLASVLRDAPLSVETPAGLWEPRNYDQKFRGRVTLRQALEQSLNVPFARLGLAIGPDRIVKTARALGIESDLKAVPSIALGALEVTPLELTRAYGVFASGGILTQLRTVLGVLDHRGSVLDRFEVSGERVFGSDETYLITSSLQGAVEQGTGRPLRSQGYRGAVAGKSGTSSNYRDAWFVAYTPDLVVGVWVGHDDGRSMRLSGSSAALPIVAKFLISSHRRGGEFTVPRGVVRASDGRSWDCSGELEVYLVGTEPAGCGGRYGGGRLVRRFRESAVRTNLRAAERRIEREMERVFREIDRAQRRLESLESTYPRR